MKDPKVEQLVSQLDDIVKQLNTVTEQLKAENVYFKLGRTNVQSPFLLQHVEQTVRYNEDV